MNWVLYEPETGRIVGQATSRDKSTVEKYGLSALEVEEFPVTPKKVVGDLLVDELPSDFEDKKIEDAWRDLRAKRGALLRQSDYTQLEDNPRDKRAWATYRQQLRDLPQTVTDPRNVIWPAPPE